MQDTKKRIRLIVYSGVIATMYVVLTLPIAQFAFGPVQFRLAEVLTVLPAFSFGFIPGVSLGCFLANLLNPNNLGPVDILFGTLATVIGGILTSVVGKKHKILGVIPPILANGIIVGGYLPFLLMDDASTITLKVVLISMLEVTLSEAVVLCVIGIPFIILINKTPVLSKLVDGVK